MSQAFHIAVIDDRKDIRELLVHYLGEHGYRVSAAESVAAFRRQLDTSAPDLLVLDIMMPGDDGLTFCRELRAKSQVPIIFLTAMAEETDRIVGLEMGADDYLQAVQSQGTAVARIKAVMRRAQSLPTPTRAAVRAEKIQFEDNVLDVRCREVVEGDGVAVPLQRRISLALRVPRASGCRPFARPIAGSNLGPAGRGLGPQYRQPNQPPSPKDRGRSCQPALIKSSSEGEEVMKRFWHRTLSGVLLAVALSQAVTLAIYRLERA
jgi:DNA-binding response OmpR family regulator